MSSKRKQSTMAALLEDKPRRGRPPRAVSRQNVYVALSNVQKACLEEIGQRLPSPLARADVPDAAISLLAARFEAMRRAVADREREIPEGIVDLGSLYLLWDLPLPPRAEEVKWTSIRVSPQQAIELGRVHGVLNTVLGANRSEVFSLGLALLTNLIQSDLKEPSIRSLPQLQEYFTRLYL